VLAVILHVCDEGRSQSREMNRGVVEDFRSTLSSIHGRNVGLLVVGVDLLDAGFWEAGDFESVVVVPYHLGLGLVNGAHAVGEIRLEGTI
jgi:hypothetical protein